MQEGNQSDKEIQASYESVRGEIVVSQSQLQSSQGVRRMIKKYQNRIAEMLKLIQRQKRQNESLKSQFKQLNEQLNNLMKRMQARPKQQQPKNVDSRYQLTKKQLQNEIKKNGILRKEVEQLRYKFQYLDGEKVDGFKNEIKEKEKIIEELNTQIKLFEKLDKQEKNTDSYKKQQELTHKIMQQNEEIVHLKKKINELKKKEEDLEKTVKTLREQAGDPKTAPKPPAEDKHKTSTHDKSPIQEELEKLKDKYKQLENAKKLNDKSSKYQIDCLNSKLRSIERDLAEAREAVARKDKQSSIMLFKLKQKERKNFNTLEPIKTVRYSEEVLHSSSGGLYETRKEFKGLTWGQGIYRQFDDSSKLPLEKNYRIKRLVWTYFEQHILSLTCDYDIVEGQVGRDLKKQTKTIESFSIPTQFNSIQIAEHLFGDYQYIISIDIYCGKGIEFIRITTSKQYILEIGNPRVLPKCKKHSFDIGSHEKPIAFMGVIEHRKIGGESKECLVNIGLELKKKQVFIREKGRRVQSSLNKSLLLKNLKID